jgi:hypothetical protein
LRNTLPEATEGVIDLNDLTNWLRPAIYVHIGSSKELASCPNLSEIY